jgi:hypothetical protein
MATLQLNQTNCEMVQCGAIPEAQLAAAPGYGSVNFQTACTIAGWGGPLGGRFCDDPVCGPFKEAILTSGWGQGLECCVEAGGTWGANGICTMPPPVTTAVPTMGPAAPVMPSAVVSTIPTMTGTANQVGQPQAPVLTATMLTQKLPSIVNPQPVVIAQACGDDFATWVNNNALLVAIALGAVAYLALGKK